MKVRQVKITNYTTGQVKFKELTVEQHNQLLMEKARKGYPWDVEVIKEREL